MAKKKRNKTPFDQQPVSLNEPDAKAPSLVKTSPTSIKWGVTGLICLIIGFVSLTQTNPSGDNVMSSLSPIALTIGYSLIGIALFLIPE